MTHSPLYIIISAFTAFIITGGGSVGVAVVATKGTLDTTTLVLSGVLGMVAAAKDTRSLLKLPPINGNGGNGDTEHFRKNINP